MANTIQLRRSNTQNAVPSLVYGELGLRVNTGGNGPRLYYGNASGTATDAKTLMPVATLTDTGLASFATADFEVTSAGAVDIKPLGVSNAQLEGSITNAKLVNDSVTIGSTSVDLGTAATSLAGMVNIDCTSGGTKSIYQNLGTGTLNLGGSSSTVRVVGDLQVDGDTVQTNVTTLQVSDPNIAVAYDNTTAGDAVDFGLFGTYKKTGEAFVRYSGLFRDVSATGGSADTGVWTVYDNMTVIPGTTINTTNSASDYELGDFSANVVHSTIDCGTFT